MIDDLRAMAIFAKTIEQGSFRAAAKLLELSPSVVSYHITQLEKRVGTALIYRSTRKLSLTHEGEVLLQYAKDMLNAAQQGLSEVTSTTAQPSGKLKLTLPSVLTRSPFNTKIARFYQCYPEIQLQIIYTDVKQDLYNNGIDFAIRAGTMDNSSLKCKRVGQINRKLVCSPEYLSKQAKPSSIKELETWHWIKLAMLPNHRSLISKDSIRLTLHFQPHISVDSVEASCQFCLQGVGLATPPNFLVDEAIEKGNLIELFPQWRVEPAPLFAVWPENVSINSNTKRLLNFLQDGIH